MDFAVFLAAALVIAFVTTYLIKRYTKHPTFYVISIIKTDRFNPIFDSLKHHKILEYLTIFGSILGFGAFGFDFFIGNKIKSLWQRIAVFLIVTVVLSAGFYFLFGPFLEASVVIPIPNAWPLAIAFGLGGFSFAISFFLLILAFHIVGTYSAGGKTCPSIAPVLPGIEIPNVDFTPPWEAWISIFLILVIHEAAHGFLARRHNVPIKSAGIIPFGPFPIGAFVEPDENEIHRMEPEKAVQIFAAGPTSNIVSMLVIGAIAILATMLIFTPLVTPYQNYILENRYSGIQISSVDENVMFCRTAYPSPAFEAGVEKGSVLRKINDQPVKNEFDLRTAVLTNAGQPAKFQFEKDGRITEKTITPNKLGQFGFRFQALSNPQYVAPPEYQQIAYGFYALIVSIVAWFLLLSFFVAISNFLPMVPFDGGRMAELIFAPYFGFMKLNEEDTRKFVKRLFFWIMVPILLINLLPLFL
ncbi:MAG: site-2 protease family protein [Candidatus Diapherotrites archaeon]|uniref:Site-2 protease family protein n=1 Tax=Candidatus Iainarchaeum sp. TaxID=3101447 RepID=A0A8T4LCB8_9ARCH|nr:site-2 protease family protein [Candidatus Diapherotrites archaeon]